MKRKPPTYSEFVFDHTLRATMVSYVPKKNRFVTLLSTLHTKKSVRDTEDKKPDIIDYYNQTKGGVNVLDERVGTYRCKRKIKRWPMALFENMLDVSSFNAFVLFTEMNPTWKIKQKKYRRRLFLLEIGDALVLPHIEVRKQLPRTENAHALVQAIRGIPIEPNEPTTDGRPRKLPPVNKRARCHVCTTRNNANLYSNRCDKCKMYVCSEHFYKVCDKCV